jgi:hypothetical protein
LTVGGKETTSRWSVALGEQSRLGDSLVDGQIVLPAGDYIVVWSTVLNKWVLDIGDFLTAKYNDGSDATADTTMDGELTLEFVGAYSIPTLTLCVTGFVPAP